MPLNPWDLFEYADDIALNYRDAEDLIFSYILKRFSDVNTDSTDQFQTWAKQQTANTVQDYALILLASVAHRSVTKLKELLDKVPVDAAKSTEKWLNNLAFSGHLTLPANIEEDRKVKSIVQSYQKTSPKYLNLAAKTMGKTAAQTFTKIIDSAVTQIQAGDTPRNAIFSATKKWTDELGVSALVDKAGRHWTPETYTRTVVMTSLNSANNDVELSRIKAYGSLVKISSHAGCRPSHLEYQGRIYDPDGRSREYPPLSDTGYGSIAGIGGINCRHYLIPYVPGIASAPPLQIDVDKNAKLYEQTQGQRRLEVNIRKAKKQLDIAQRFGQPVDVKRAQALVSKRQAEMRQYIRKTGLTRQYEREQIQSA